MNLSKVVSTCVYKRILRFQRCNMYGSGDSTSSGAVPGGFRLNNNLLNAASATGNAGLPLHCFLLDGTANTYSAETDSSLNINLSHCVKELQVDRANGNISFATLTGQNKDGTDAGGTDQWHMEWQNDVPSSTQPAVRKLLNHWVDIRLLLYGTNNQDTVYDIMVVRFREDHFDPIETGGTAADLDDRKAFWQGMIRSSVSNPIIPSGTGIVHQKQLIVLKHQRVMISPTQNTDNDGSPGHQIVKIFMPMNRVCDYGYQAESLTGAVQLNGAGAQIGGLGWNPQNNTSTDFSNIPKPKARTWLIVRALNALNSSSAWNTDEGNNKQLVPSYDVVIRKKEAFTFL